MKPLVSICIPNYNYGHYLEYCLNSVLNQTYNNIEVYFRDNNSTDNSLEIALQYKKRFEEKGIYFNIAYNKRNVGSDKNSNLLLKDSEGEFIYVLASDDAIEPTFIEKCVNIFEKNPNVSTVITHRKEIDENNTLYETPSFYNTNCIIDKESQAAVYMMAGIAIPGQRMFRNATLKPIKKYNRIFNVAGDWYNNFLACMVGDVAYLKEPLVQYRVHTGNETNESEKNLLGIFEHYQLINSFVDISKAFGMTKPAARYDKAVEKLGSMCLRYALKMYKCRLNDVAHRYLLLAPVFKRNIVEDEKYKELLSFLTLTDDELKKAVLSFEEKYNLNRTVSYDPPEGYIPLDL